MIPINGITTQKEILSFSSSENTNIQPDRVSRD